MLFLVCIFAGRRGREAWLLVMFHTAQIVDADYVRKSILKSGSLGNFTVKSCVLCRGRELLVPREPLPSDSSRLSEHLQRLCLPPSSSHSIWRTLLVRLFQAR